MSAHESPAKAPTPPRSSAAPPPPPADQPEKMSSGYSLPRELHEVVRKAAAERGMATSYLVQRALEDYIPRLIPIDQLALVRPPGYTAPDDVPPATRRVTDSPQA